jgi:hypothetical protein
MSDLVSEKKTILNDVATFLNVVTGCGTCVVVAGSLQNVSFSIFVLHGGQTETEDCSLMLRWAL